jgi:hypothetical protein
MFRENFKHLGVSGRGQTKHMSPRNVFISSGNSLTLVFYKNLPTGRTLGSLPELLSKWLKLGLPTNIVANLRSPKTPLIF